MSARGRLGAWRAERKRHRAESRAGRSPRRLGFPRLWREGARERPAHRPVTILRGPRLAALSAIAVLVAAASLTSFAESYRGLYDWSYEHGLTGAWAAIWPLQVDVFIAVGELALFVALVDAWERRSRIGAWTVTLAGLSVSVAGNVGHVLGHSATDRLTAAVPPLTAAAALAVGLGVLKRVVERHHQAAGTGIGLTVVSELARAHGGTAEAASEPGQGTTFTVRLPAQAHTDSEPLPHRSFTAAT